MAGNVLALFLRVTCGEGGYADLECLELKKILFV